MPRKKNAVVAAEATPTPTPEVPQPTPSARSRRRPKAEATVPTPAPDPVVEPVAAAKPAKTARKRTSVTVPPTPAPQVIEEVLPPAITKGGRSNAKPSPFDPIVLDYSQIEEEEVVEAPAPVAPAPKTSRGRGKSAKPAAAEPTPVPSPAPVAEPVEAAKAPAKAKGRGRAKATPTVIEAVAESSTPAEFDPSFDYAGLDLPVPTWRPRMSAAAAKADKAAQSDDAGEEDSSTSAGDDDNKRRRRRRRRGGRPSPEETTAAPVAVTVEPKEDASAVEPAPTTATFRERKRPPAPAAAPAPVPAVAPAAEAPRSDFRRERSAPKVPAKAMINIPPDAPQVAVRDGIPTLVRNGRVYPPIFFFGSPADEKRANTVLEEVRMAAEAGVHLHSYLIDFEVDLAAIDASIAMAAYMLAQSVATDPESQVVFRIAFNAPRGWEDRYPDARYRAINGEAAEPSVCDEAFWSVARTCVEKFCRALRLLDLKDHILGLHIERGEWFLPHGHGYDTSKAALKQFREWARTRYVDDEVTLRASWFDGSSRFDTMTVPPYNPEGSDGERFIRSSRKQRRYVDYHLFLSDATVHRIGDLAYAAKAASDGNFLIGASYGYTFEWTHPDSGHLSLGKLLRTPEIDFIAGPPSYRSREPGGSASFPGPIDSFALNGKLFISEEDYKTSLSSGHEPDDFNPRLKTPQALDSVHWRGAGAALAHGSGVTWMDVWGNGWLKTHSVWERAARVRDALIDRMASPLSDPDVAVFIDERALAYLVDSNAFALLVQNVRESILRAGVSAGFYLLSDLQHREKFPESKLYLFLNAWDVRPELRSAIKTRLQRNGKVLFWLYAAGLFDAGRNSLERAREVTGIALKPQPYYSKAGTTILNRRHPLSEAFPDRSVVGGAKLEPSYFAIPEGATVLGEYTQTGLPSFVVREFNEGPAETHWTSVFLGEPMVNPALIRALAQMAGAHVWNFHEDVVHVRPPFCTVHCGNAGPRTITLPPKYSAYSLLTNEWAAVDTANLKFTAVEGSTHCFLIGPKDDLETLLKSDPASLLRMDQLPPRDINVRVDVSNFDVPIMRLDEWMEGTSSDENADEWFLRPAPIEEERPAPAVETPERVGRRRRRRRGGRGGDDRDDSNVTETVSASVIDPALDDFGLNVMFRKRE